MSPTSVIYDWNARPPEEGAREVARPLAEADDETLRDGLQSPSAKNPPIQSKLEFLRILVKMGVQAVDIGLPAAGPHIMEDTLILAKEIANERLPIEPNCAARTLSGDIRPILEISQRAGVPIRVATFIGSSAIRQYTEGWDLRFLLKATQESVTQAVRAGMPVLFVTEDTTRAHPDVLRALYTAAIDCGADRVCLADTVGCATPEGARRLVAYIRAVADASGVRVGIDWHGHMDRGLGIGAALAALDAGANRVHGSAMGLGERVGNTPLDLLLINLKLMGRWGGDMGALSEYVEWVARWTGVPIPWNYPVFGRDAYRTGTGVHAAAILKALQKGDQNLVDIVYSAVPASWFSRQQTIVVGPMSGESNVLFWLRQHGVEPLPERVRVVLKLAKDSDHTLTDDEVFDALARLEKP